MTRAVKTLVVQIQVRLITTIGLTQMMEAGVPLPQIMSVTGHNHVASVKPYMKNTYLSANNALTARYAHVESNTVSNIGK